MRGYYSLTVQRSPHPAELVRDVTRAFEWLRGSMKSGLAPITAAVTGGRDFDGRAILFGVLDAIHQVRGIELLLHGDQRGADTLADLWADVRGVPRLPYPPNWDSWGRAAGPIRNREMLSIPGINVLVAFPGNRGTQNAVQIADELGIPTLTISEEKTP